MSNEEIKKQFIKKISEHFGEVAFTKNVIDRMINVGVITEKKMLLYCVKHDFTDLLIQAKQKKSMREIQLEVSEKYSVSLSFVKKTIYHRDEIKI